MKRFFSILSAFIFLAGAAGYYLAFTAADTSMKTEMAVRIESKFSASNFIQLTFSNDQLLQYVRFIDAGQKEFIYKNEHYDVIKEEHHGEKISFICLADKKETMLFKEFGKQLTEQSSGNSTDGKTNIKTQMQDWFFQIQSSEIPIETSPLFFTNEVFFPVGNSHEIPSPPPKV